jgi:hypothetical protein
MTIPRGLHVVASRRTPKAEQGRESNDNFRTMDRFYKQELDTSDGLKRGWKHEWHFHDNLSRGNSTWPGWPISSIGFAPGSEQPVSCSPLPATLHCHAIQAAHPRFQEREGIKARSGYVYLTVNLRCNWYSAVQRRAVQFRYGHPRSTTDEHVH